MYESSNTSRKFKILMDKNEEEWSVYYRLENKVYFHCFEIKTKKNETFFYDKTNLLQNEKEINLKILPGSR